MTTPTVPQAPPLSRLPNVELMHSGTWSASTGVHTFTSDDFAYAVAALDCPAVRRPYLKLGHTDPRFDGEPAVGWIDNLTTVDSGHGLQGDYVGMPGWLGPILASAYPDRSIEGSWDYRCALGHTHPFVLTGVALLGITAPAIGTLESLQDVATLYGVAASRERSGTPVSVQMKGTAMPNPSARTVAASATTEDVRRSYYDTAPWSVWIEEFHLDPLQLIVIDDDNGERQRVPVLVDPDADGTDAITFGPAVPVVVRYEDASATEPTTTDESGAVAASAGSDQIIRYANRAESRPGQSPRASITTPAAAVAGTPEGGSTVEITDDQLTALREALGLAEDADIDAIVTSVEELATAPAAAASTEPAGDTAAASARLAAAGVVTIDGEVLASLESRASRGDAAAARQEREDRERVVDTALSEGKITPARRAHYLALMSADPQGTTELLSGLPKELAVPLSEVGHGQNAEASAATVTDNDIYKGWNL